MADNKPLPKPVNVFDDLERDAERALEGKQGTTHAAAYDEECPVCTHKFKDAIETLYSRGEPPAEIAKQFAITSQAVQRHARGLNLDIALSKDIDRALALVITQGLHDLHPHSVDAKVLLGAIHERAVLDGKIVQRVHMDKPPQIIFMGSTPDPGVIRGKAEVIDERPPIPLDVPTETTLQLPADKKEGAK